MEEESFKKENIPYRDLQLLVVNERGWSEASVRTCIDYASAQLMAQVGIRLQIREYHERRIPSFTQSEAMESLWGLTADHEKFDLILGFSPRSPVSHMLELATGYAWLGAIDDTYRKFLILKTLDEAVLIHEICHAFVFSQVHSKTGVLNTFIIKIPLVPVLLNFPKYLSKKDRQEVLRNKWRDFNVRPEIPEEAKTDLLPVEKNKNSTLSSM
jgi:hypothetical protein